MTAASTAATREQVLKRGAVALVGSVVVNWVVLGAVLFGDLAPAYEALEYPPVTIFTAAGAVGATAVYAVLTRYVEDPDRTFTVVAVVVLLLSFAPDLWLLESDPEATLSVVLALMFMHVTAAAVCVAVLTGRLGVGVE